MNAQDILDDLRAVGITVKPRSDGNLFAAPKELLTPARIEHIRNHKKVLLAHFRTEQQEAEANDWAQDDLFERARKPAREGEQSGRYLVDHVHERAPELLDEPKRHLPPAVRHRRNLPAPPYCAANRPGRDAGSRQC